MGVKIEGLKELRQKLLAIGAIAGQKVIASAARAAMKPVLEEARRLAPVHRGVLRDSIKLKATKPRRGRSSKRSPSRSRAKSSISM